MEERLQVQMSGSIISCKNTATVKKNATFASPGDGWLPGEGIAGICGCNSQQGKIQNCLNSGVITGNHGAGGIVGFNSGIIQASANFGKITGTQWDNETFAGTGGIVGVEYVSGNGTYIENCYNIAEVQSVTHGGGIIGGIVDCSKVDIRNCYNRGTIRGTGCIVGWISMENESIVKATNNYWLKTSQSGTGGIANCGMTAERILRSRYGNSHCGEEYGNGS